MTEQKYRAVVRTADGRQLYGTLTDIESAREEITAKFTEDRIERPVPTTDEHEAVNTLNLGYYRTKVECSCGGSWWFGEHEGDPTHDDAKAAHLQPSPDPPTREQIAKAISEVRQSMERDQLACLSTDEAFHRLEAALIQNGADR